MPTNDNDRNRIDIYSLNAINFLNLRLEKVYAAQREIEGGVQRGMLIRIHRQDMSSTVLLQVNEMGNDYQVYMRNAAMSWLAQEERSIKAKMKQLGVVF